MLLSVLIPTLEVRAQAFERLRDGLNAQARAAGLVDEVEILSVCDNGEQPTGTKRNRLLQQASGEFVAFVDDDDTISSNYLACICGSIRAHPEVDCLGIQGVILFRGAHPHQFVHSLRYADYSSAGGVYTRPPYHLNPIRRDIATRYRFEDVYYSEDIDWARRMTADRALRTEQFIDTVIYTYHSRRWWPYQWMIDHTEAIRHALGLRFDNRLRVQRKLKAIASRRPGIAAR